MYEQACRDMREQLASHITPDGFDFPKDECEKWIEEYALIVSTSMGLDAEEEARDAALLRLVRGLKTVFVPGCSEENENAVGELFAAFQDCMSRRGDASRGEIANRVQKILPKLVVVNLCKGNDGQILCCKPSGEQLATLDSVRNPSLTALREQIAEQSQWRQDQLLLTIGADRGSGKMGKPLSSFGEFAQAFSLGGGGYTMDEVAKHTTESDCWIVVANQVLNVTTYLSQHQHPGGNYEILSFAGKDASEEFNMIHSPDVIGKYAPDAVIGMLGAGGGDSLSSDMFPITIGSKSCSGGYKEASDTVPVNVDASEQGALVGNM